MGTAMLPATRDDGGPGRTDGRHQPRGSTGLRYRPALDGLRAFAVAAVLLYHAGERWMGGGFLGVDAFFVLSGYLITSLLLAEWGARGGIRLGAFWARRARRLLPALALVLGGVAVYAAVFADPTELTQIRLDALAALGYVANWRFILSGRSYFAQFALPSPVRHLWSLAIEEQFYLVWPLVVYGVLRWRRGSLRALLALTLVLGAASAVLMALLHHGGDPSRVYYGTDTRAQSVLVGATLAILLTRHPVVRTLPARSALRTAALLGATYTLWAWSGLTERSSFLYSGGFLVGALAVAAVIASVVQPDPGAMGRFLSLRPLRWVGKVSYGLYLWHWPIFLVLTSSRTGWDGASLLAARLAVTVAFAATSFYLLEQPIRHGAVHGRRAWTLVPATALAVVVALLVTTTGARPGVAEQTVAALAKRPPPTVGAASAPGERPASKVLLVGDSVAATMGLGLSRTEQPAHLAVWNRATLGCGISRGGAVVLGGRVEAQSSGCDDWPTRWASYLDEFDPDVVVMLVGAWDVLDRRVGDRWLRLGTVEHDEYFLHELGNAVDVLSSRGARVVILTTPFYSRPELLGASPGVWTEYEPWRVDRLNALYRDWVDAHPGRATLLDLNALVSPGGRFVNDIDGVDVRDDGVHFTAAGADLVARWLAPKLRTIGTLAPGAPVPAGVVSDLPVGRPAPVGHLVRAG